MRIFILSPLILLGVLFLGNSLKTAPEGDYKAKGAIEITIREVEPRGVVGLGVKVITGYSSTIEECDSTPFIMASGERVYDGAIACPREMPFGTRVMIEGKVYICEDRMSLKHPDRFDIWFSETELAIAFGKQKLEVSLID